MESWKLIYIISFSKSENSIETKFRGGQSANMASRAAPGVTGSSRSPPFSFRSAASLPMISLPVRIHANGKTNKGLTVRAMAVAKFKGTQRREKQLTEMIERKVTEAKEVCEGDETSDECKVAWDEVEEVSQAKADLRLKLQQEKDPLESFCQDNPETDECRVYED
ncbi:calvin cycle protein CP12-3, chloroplastic [Juglans microcarpa x Juglans regia]|uniref:calvin cycle protein CP12-3, chloroplastic n=1 Tax=Juglans microcarpa x Juglans regia TaxID=2249226 RepID=UPI001B7DA5E3|nr:calvin cycle protein CP12-3, chloroplastic [Juglans microcarpa x Juglans regia]